MEEAEDDDRAEVTLDDVIHLLPEEEQAQLRAMMEAAGGAVEAVEKELHALLRVVKSTVTVQTLKHTVKRLGEYRFDLDMDNILELDMLTTAFVVTYARLHHGNAGSGFKRNDLPEELQEVHDEILEVRNKRFAHIEDHASVSTELEIRFKQDHFELNFAQNLGYHIGGDGRWAKLVGVIDQLYGDRVDRLKARMEQKTGYKWSLPGPPPADYRPFIELAPGAEVIDARSVTD